MTRGRALRLVIGLGGLFALSGGAYAIYGEMQWRRTPTRRTATGEMNFVRHGGRWEIVGHRFGGR
jgi:hypothetical protein